MIQNLDGLLRAAAGISTHRALVVFPANEETFAAVREAHERLGLQFILVGDRSIIEPALSSRAGIEVLDRAGAAESLAASVELLGKSDADILMNGSLDTGALIKTALQPESGLRTGKLLSTSSCSSTTHAAKTS
jgi:hypothetical protein